MAEVWDEARVQQYIDDGIEESPNLEYKAAAALSKKKTSEITKDVSSFANSDGGIIIYGLSEDKNSRHLPGKIDPVNRREFSKERLEHIISNIRPKINGLIIHPVPIGNSNTDVVYVVDVPKSHTMHQATDKKYYKRYNFEAVPMDHYEILELLNRNQHPQIKLDFEIIRSRFISSDMGNKRETGPNYSLVIHATNSGKVYARHTDIQIEIPSELQHFNAYSIWDEPKADIEPMFPGRRYRARDIALRNDFDKLPLEDLYLTWIVSADSAPKSEGKVAFSDIKVIDRPITIVRARMDAT